MGWRQGELGHWYADACGVAVVAVVWLIARWFKRASAL